MYKRQGLEYAAVRDLAELGVALGNDRQPSAAGLIEVITDGAADHDAHRAILAAVAAAVQEVSSADQADHRI